jgi:AcrR family transcriptional regulator
VARAAKTARRTRGLRKTRAHGEESRRLILAAATGIAGERGYEGTSIARVSERSGLPASSIYWHFEDKDALIAAVIEDSFARWLEGIGRLGPVPGGLTREAQFEAAIRRSARALLEAPEFLRLGLMLALERRPREARGRTIFLRVRAQTFERIAAAYREFFGEEIDAAGVRELTTLTIAAADGLFIARDTDRQDLDLEASFELLAAALLGAAERLRSRQRAAPRRTSAER